MTNDALRKLMPIAGWPEEHADAVQLTGDTDPILPTTFRIGETSSAALGAVGLAIADLWELRTGRHQEVSVNTRQATASMRSGKYMQMEAAPVSTERNQVMGVYPAMAGKGVIQRLRQYIHLPLATNEGTAAVNGNRYF